MDLALGGKAPSSSLVAAIGGFATGNFTKSEDVASIVAFLASERSANVTGSNYLIEGGLIKTI